MNDLTLVRRGTSKGMGAREEDQRLPWGDARKRGAKQLIAVKARPLWKFLVTPPHNRLDAVGVRTSFAPEPTIQALGIQQGRCRRHLQSAENDDKRGEK
jgi:hypothetical protein